MADDDGKDTRVLPRRDTPIDLEGTAEVDRAALLAALSGDRSGLQLTPKNAPRQRDTEQNVAVPDLTVLREAAGPAKHQVTQHYQVPQTLLDQVREEFQTLEVELLREDDDDDDDDSPTATFSMDSILEFDAVVDAEGRLALPASALKGRFAPGTRLRVVARPADE